MGTTTLYGREFPQHDHIWSRDTPLVREYNYQAKKYCVFILIKYLHYSDVATRHGHDKYLDLIIKAEADVNSLDVNGKTALMIAAERGHNNCVCRLVQAGADVNINTIGNERALLFAVMNNHYKCLHLCLTSGAEINLLHYKGVNALTEYLMTYDVQKQRAKVIKLLYAAGETVDEYPILYVQTKVKVPDCLNQLNDDIIEMRLSHLCREVIRKQLMDVSSVNLFCKVTRVGLPCPLQEYLLYNVLRDDED